jgi:hypothetical protein
MVHKVQKMFYTETKHDRTQVYLSLFGFPIFRLSIIIQENVVVTKLDIYVFIFCC